ncbi:MAG: Mss4-like protein [Lentinula lateritia]|uniref:Mss4-like protein n=1 Tax=Lentinula lateritia TaxID=40482 RepID=A0ABQ8VDN8_9AGAR|nr:MAG: Mss4-like protein [Lentinula lateritia]KAJ4489185.1 Mss4-like protein [Lentinula lateritia]
MSLTAESEVEFKGSCYCGAVTYVAKGKPILSAYCHCTLCQRLAASPCVATIHFPAAAFNWTHAEPREAALDVYSVANKPWKNRFRCKGCGACVASYSTTKFKYSVWAGQLERDEEGKIRNWDLIKPTAHMFYATRMLDFNDGLPKWEGYEGQSKRIG